MVEQSALPLRGGVTQGAVRWEAGRDVVGIVGRLVVVDHVASRADGWRAFVDVVDVAGSAGHGGVEAGQRELRRRIVVEHGAVPLGGGVAQRAVLREAGRDVVRIRSGVVARQVAAVARVRRSFEHIVDVAH